MDAFEELQLSKIKISEEKVFEEYYLVMEP